MTTVTLPDRVRCVGLDPYAVADARLVLADLDGCLISEGLAFSDASIFIDAVINAVAEPVAFVCIGKPAPPMAQVAMGATGVAVRDAVLAGDNAATDGALARAMGMHFVHVVQERAV